MKYTTASDKLIIILNTVSTTKFTFDSVVGINSITVSRMASLSWFTLFACVLIHTQTFVANWWIGLVTYSYWPIFWSTIQGLLYLSYPVFGLLSEVFRWNFKTILVSFILMAVSSILMLVTSTVWIIGVVYSLWPPIHNIIVPVQVPFLVIGIISVGMFEANAIQFGMDQMFEASSKQLSSFIRWYFWCAHIGAIVLIYLVIGVCLYGFECKVDNFEIQDDAIEFVFLIALLSSCIQLPVSIIGIIACVYYKKKFPIEQASRKPLRLIYNVLKYSYNHKQPERRSALTFWESDIPSRIDLGKHKYGGPFTYEQVESVKTVIRLLLLMVSLFGFHLSGDGYSVSTYIMNTAGCPTAKVFLGLIGNPQHIGFLIVFLCIPLFEILKLWNKFYYVISLESRIWIGLFICLINEALQCLYSIILQSNLFHCPEVEVFHHHVPVMLKCLVSNLNIVTLNNTCQHFCSSPPVNDTIIYLSVIIMILHGLAYVLVFSTVLEFICAQSPNETKGLLIGLWYSMLSIKSFFINIIDTQVLMDTTEFNIYHGTKGVAIFISLAAFSIVCKKYKYRERNEIVNEQAMIEEQYERELLMNSHVTEDNYSIN